MKLQKLSSDIDIKRAFKRLDVSREGAEIMSKKAKTNLFLIKNIKLEAANILKQDALSIGAELAVPHFAALCEKKEMDAILMATDKQLESLIKKEKRQPFGLKNLSSELQKHHKTNTPKEIKVMGVINVNDDSFYEGSRFAGESAIEKIEQMIAEGAQIIDVGALSTRPGSDKIAPKEELARLEPVLKAIRRERLYEKALFSIDSYEPLAVEAALEHGFGMVNDITGLKNENIAKLAASYRASVVIMHMQGTPKDMQDNPKYDDVVLDVARYFEERIDVARRCGVEEIILDVGIGFGKSLEHNLLLLKHLSHFKYLDCELLVGASRKSLIDKISRSLPKDRLCGTIALHLEALKNGAAILRVHDVKEHIQAIKVYQALEGVEF